MYERFTDSARRVVALAEATAFTRGATQVQPEDVLVALAQHHGVAGSVLRAVAADDALLRDALHAVEPPVAPPADRARPLPLSHVSMQAFGLAVREADGFRVPLVGTEHLLLGLLREPTGRAASLLLAIRRDPGGIRERVFDLVSSPGYLSPEQPVADAGTPASLDRAPLDPAPLDPAPLDPPRSEAPSDAPADPASAAVDAFTADDRALLVELVAEVGRLRAEVATLRATLERPAAPARGYDDRGDRKLA